MPYQKNQKIYSHPHLVSSYKFRHNEQIAVPDHSHNLVGSSQTPYVAVVNHLRQLESITVSHTR